MITYRKLLPWVRLVYCDGTYLGWYNPRRTRPFDNGDHGKDNDE